MTPGGALGLLSLMLFSGRGALLRRARILRVLANYGFGQLVRRQPGVRTEDIEGIKPVAVGDTPPRRFRLMLEELGPTFIKLGQLLSSRPDLVSPAYVEELRTLQDDCEPLPFAEIELALHQGLSHDPSELFEHIEETPLATASIAQVHAARTKTGEEVVIKVQRPGIAEEVRQDIDILYNVAWFLDAVVAESEMTEPVGIVAEFDRALTEELNFRTEAMNAMEFRLLHKDRPDIAVPKVYTDLSTGTVLTMERLRGVPFSRLPEGVDKKAVAERVVREAFDEAFIDGVFHADPHPGNLLYLDDGRFGILDFGLLGRLSDEMKETMVVLVLAVAMRDADTVARTLYRMGQSDTRIDLAEIRKDTNKVFRRYLDRSIQDVDATLMLHELLMLGMKHRLRIPPEYTMLGRAGATIEGIVRDFHPEMDVPAVAKPYAERLLVDRVVPGRLEGGVLRTLLQLEGVSQELPLQLSQILADLASGRFTVNLAGAHVDRLNHSLMMAANTIAGAFLAGAFIIGAFIGLAQIDVKVGGVPLVGVIGALVGGVVAVWVGAYSLLRPRIKRISVLSWWRRLGG